MDKPIVTLELLIEPGRGIRYLLSGDSAVIGRGEEADIRLADTTSVSRRHAEVSIRNNSVFIRDLESQNGTFVQGDRVKEQALSDGALVRVGAVEFRVHIDPMHTLSPPAKQGSGASLPVAGTGPSRPPAKARAASEMGFPEKGFRKDGKEKSPAAGAASRPGAFLWKAAALVTLIVGILYAVDWLATVAPFSATPQYVIRRHEKLVLLLPVATEGFTDSNVAIRAGEGEDVAHWERFGGLIGKEYTGRVLVVKGNANGRATVAVRRGGRTVFQCIAHVRGVLPREWPEDIAAGPARALAEQKIAVAGELEAHQPYAAMLCLRDASELYILSGDPAKAKEVDLAQTEIQSRLRQEVSRLYAEARASIKGAPGSPQDLDKGSDLLFQIMQLIPDPRSEDWQLANLVQKDLEKELVR
ncbi:MAG: FHA domain-containing protein [Planctomycetota bacterium]